MDKYFLIKPNNQYAVSVEKSTDASNAMLDFATSMDLDMNTYFYAEECSKEKFDEFQKKGYVNDTSESFDIRLNVEDEVDAKQLPQETIDKAVAYLKHNELFLQTLGSYIEEAINAVQ